MKKNIQHARKSLIKDVFVKDITELIHPIARLPISRIPIVNQTERNELKILSFMTFLEEVRCLATNGKVPFKLFQNYLEKRKKSKLLVS